MVQEVEAIYERGVLRPLQCLNLKDSERVRLSIASGSAQTLEALVDHTLLRYARSRSAGLARVPTIEEVRSGLSAIEGSLAELINQERGEY